ncbi:hypothetical protein PTSG_08575 [Salpingoeca rosetta]|uniref:Amino acid transporter transmembrane domain-containing protein n=1 Tax=Salpingoeca rosetta (strain ATCC 50818 / BSB-021) TaxID=946362 RepID=F2UK30_SALR5|nr:uncharacterized protein PTSG_08575 [Salpingoeca rosetta]EGD77479.1 hypothetical protein PTSG_08575 [Salpingoeca rosetta]|eukprot:XP_004990367.1 hypothetical protein PTSG_08575 [Salpingoeca rosetta]
MSHHWAIAQRQARQASKQAGNKTDEDGSMRLWVGGGGRGEDGLEEEEEVLVLGSGLRSLPSTSELSQEEPEAGTARSSVATCTFNLINTIIGAGVLSLPYAFALTGYAGGIILLLLNVVGADYSLRALLHCSKACGRRTYEGVTEFAFGRVGLAIVSASSILLNIGAATAYIVIIGDTLPHLIVDFGGEDFLARSWERIWCTGMVMMIALIPLSLLRNVTYLGYTSLLSFACVFVFVFVMLGIATEGPQHDPDAIEHTKPAAFVGSTNLFRAASLLAFSFTCHSTMFPIYLELEKPTVKRMTTAIHSAMIVCFGLYLIVGLCGYLTYQDTDGGVKGDVLVNIGLNENRAITNVVRIMYLISIISTYPLALPPIRQAVGGLLFQNDHPTSWPILRHLALSFAVLVLTFLFGNYVPVLEFVFGLTGATGGVMLVYILPAAISLKVRQRLSVTTRVILWTMLIVGIALGVLSTAYTIVDHVS